MNTNGLAKLYEHLKPKERLSLILAASARDDEAELDRLARSAPREGYRLPDYHGLAEAMQMASMFHLLELLDLAALYWQTGGLLAEREALNDEEGDGPPKKLRATVGMFAYMLTVKVDGWKRFCCEFNVDPDLLMKELPGFGTVQRAEQAARVVACTPDEATDWIRRRGDDAPETSTAEAEAASLSAFVDGWAERWG
jgi:hypothetical protein